MYRRSLILFSLSIVLAFRTLAASASQERADWSSFFTTAEAHGTIVVVDNRNGGCKPEPQKFPSPSHYPLAGVDLTVVSPAAIELIRAIDSKQVGCFRIREI